MVVQCVCMMRRVSNNLEGRKVTNTSESERTAQVYRVAAGAVSGMDDYAQHA